MTDTIVMRHPTLPPTQEIEVPRGAMSHYTLAGWQLVPQEELDDRAARAAAAAAEAAAAEKRAEPSAAPDTAAADEPDTSEPADTSTRPARPRARAHEKKGE
ncbi:hypothetical protein ACWD5V_09515 [Streptomyces sp. NPDC002523]